MTGGVIFRSVGVDEIKISEHELAARVGCYCSSAPLGLERALGEVRAASAPRICYLKVGVEYPRPGVVSVGGCEMVSAGLLRCLCGAREAYLVAVTLGGEVDRLLRRAAVSSGAEHFLLDGAASAMCEALCEVADREIREGRVCTGRYSPGYGDLSLDVQPKILDRLSAARLLGITLTDEYLMIPTKSITAIIGVKNG